MEIEVTDGLGVITIGSFEVGEYFKIERPVSVVWGDNKGSIAEYLCQLPYNGEYREKLRNSIIENLYQDFTGKEEDLYVILKPIFSLLENGHYKLYFSSNTKGECFQYYTSGDNHSQVHVSDWALLCTNLTKVEETEVRRIEYEKFKAKNKRTKEYADTDIIDYFTYNFYEGSGSEYFISTRPITEINPERVKYYENEIQNGKRPFAILMYSYLPINVIYPDGSVYDESDYSKYYVLDGHHKLMAYQNLNLYPPVATIGHFPKQINFSADFEALAEKLYPWQVEHILRDWDSRDIHLKELLKNPESILHKFIKNGYHREYYENGRLKHEAYYVNDKVYGISRGWHKNRKLKYEYNFEKGLRTGVWKDWHENGKLCFIQNFDEHGAHNGDLISYFENGQMRMKQQYKNGMNMDGLTYETWYKSGAKEAELRYKDGKIIERRNFDPSGKIINHETF